MRYDLCHVSVVFLIKAGGGAWLILVVANEVNRILTELRSDLRGNLAERRRRLLQACGISYVAV